MREELNELAQSLKWRRLLIVGFLVFITQLIAEIIFDFVLEGWYRFIYVCIAYGFWDSMLDLIKKTKKKK